MAHPVGYLVYRGYLRPDLFVFLYRGRGSVAKGAEKTVNVHEISTSDLSKEPVVHMNSEIDTCWPVFSVADTISNGYSWRVERQV